MKKKMDKKRKSKFSEKLFETLFFISACVAVLSVVAITVFVFWKGTPAIFEIGLIDFLSGADWQPRGDIYGILPMIVASILSTLGATIVGVLIGIFTAVFLAEIAPPKLSNIARSGIELLAGIPSVVYGFFGLMVIVPLISNHLGGPGNSLLAIIFVLTVMILPTIVSITESSIRAVPKSYKEGSLALGASHIQTIFKVMIPAARSGILAGVVLGIGRAIGETMAVILISGNTPRIPTSVLDPVRTLTANIALEMGYAAGLHQDALFATGVILFVFIMILNLMLNVIVHKKAGEAK